MDDILDQTALINLRVNGEMHELEVMPGRALLDVLRDDLGVTGPHMGCMTGHCGACTVEVDGDIVKSCIIMAASLPRAKIRTLEGLQDADGNLSPVQQVFWDEAGLQCGYCAPGMVLSTLTLLGETDAPTDAQIDTALAGNLCRCTGYKSIKRAVKAAAKAQREAAAR